MNEMKYLSNYKGVEFYFNREDGKFYKEPQSGRKSEGFSTFDELKQNINLTTESVPDLYVAYCGDMNRKTKVISFGEDGYARVEKDNGEWISFDIAKYHLVINEESKSLMEKRAILQKDLAETEEKLKQFEFESFYKKNKDFFNK